MRAKRTNHFERALDDQFQEILKVINGNIGTNNIVDKAITLAKMADITTSSLLGRITAGTGVPEVLTAANVLSILGLSTIASAWSQFNPSWSNLTIGSGGTNDGYYIQVGKIVMFRTHVILGTGPTVGAVTLSLPATAIGYPANTPIGWSQIVDASPSAVYFGTILSSGGMRVMNAAGTYLTLVGFGASAPMTWAAGDSFTVQGIYEAA